MHKRKGLNIGEQAVPNGNQNLLQPDISYKGNSQKHDVLTKFKQVRFLLKIIYRWFLSIIFKNNVIFLKLDRSIWRIH